ncbi:MAG: DUF1684 domain-containing protein [Candidatus Kariarchaeaceae archaeon]|jgi:uncharacterized protein (DUF1684 family)
MSYKKQVELQRASKDRYFKTSHHSPLSHDERDGFIGLDYFPIDEKYRFELTLNKYDDPEIVEMEVSSGGINRFKRIGYLTFQINEVNTDIHVYQSFDNPDHYFVPFRDSTSGEESYGAGRYLDIEPDGQVFVLDFNLAYSPLCAYSDNYACPLPPFENWLQIPIRAGEKDFHLPN